MIRIVKVNAQHCTCNACAHEWLSLADKAPPICPACKTRAWNGAKPMGRPPGVRSTDPTRHKLKRVRAIQ